MTGRTRVLRGTGVSVSALCPGPVDTEFSALAKRAGEADAAPAPDFLKLPVERIAREAQILDDAPADQVFLNDALSVFRRHEAIPGAFRIHDRRRAIRADA